MQNEIIDKYVSNFALLEDHLNGQKKHPVHEMRKAAIESFRKLGFPGRKDEYWKYTDINAFSKHKLEAYVAPENAIKFNRDNINTYDHIKANKLIFVDGLFSREMSEIIDKEDGWKIGSLKQSILENDPTIKEYLGNSVDVDRESFGALNTAFMQDGALIHIKENTTLQHPVMILFVSSGQLKYIANPRNLIIADKSSKLVLIEDSQVLQPGTESRVNLLSEIFLHRNARVEHTIIQDHDDGYHQISTYKVSQHRDSRYRSSVVSLGGKLIRNNTEVFFDEENCECDLRGVYISEGNSLIDNHLLVSHRKPHCLSNQLFKGILDNDGKAVFNGKVYVAEDAQKTNAYQSNKNILLSSKATINTKPELEIFADDVKCSHGATSGQLDEDALFYLKARGIPEDRAKSLMIYAFVNEVVEEINHKLLRSDIDQRIRKKLKLDED